MKLQKAFLGLMCASVLISGYCITTADFKGITYDTKNGSITIASNGESITVADKNVGAKKVGYGKNADTDSYGLYYQWGGMTGYEYYWTSTEAVLHGFEQDINRYLASIDGWTISQQAELCGAGYHIPTHEERGNVLKMYKDNGNDLKDFNEAFKIPLAGSRSFLGADAYNIDENAYFWTASPNGDGYASVLRVEESSADNNYGSSHVYGHTIRCFKDEKSTKIFKGVTHNESDGTITITDGKSKIILRDKNVGATDIGYGVNAHRLSYGNYYQRGGTTGYSYYLTKEEALAKGFVTQRFDDKIGEWDKMTANIKAWDGKSICGNGYHVPSYTEWKNLIDMYKSNGNQLIDFYEAFLIPSAGERTYFDVVVTQDAFNANLWSATPRGDDSIYNLYGNGDNIQLFGAKRANAFPVRCFKDMDSPGVGSVSLKNNSEDINDEMVKAHKFAYENGITSIANVSNAKMNNNLTRIAMAKMLSQYAINILGKSPDKSKIANFSDVSSSLDISYNHGVTLAYQLGIMGVGTDRFRPNDIVTRAEFGTALSRMLYGISDGDPYYLPHLNKLKSEGIVSNTNPNLHEKRGYVMLMLMRSAK